MDIEKKILLPGAKIELRPDAEMEGHEKEESQLLSKFYSSKISDIKEDGVIEAYMPIEQRRLIMFSVDSVCTLYCYAPSGIYQGKVVIVNRYKNGEVYFLLMKLVSELKKNQRREYFRYEIDLPMRDRKMEGKEVGWLTKRSVINVDDFVEMDNSRIIDISGGGLRFGAGHLYNEGDFIYCKFEFGKQFSACAKILDREVGPGESENYIYRAEFMCMDSRDREDIIGKIFQAQRSARSRRPDR